MFPRTARTTALIALAVTLCIMLTTVATSLMPTTSATPRSPWTTSTTTRELDGTYAAWAASFNTTELSDAVPELVFDGTNSSLSFDVGVDDAQAIVNEAEHWELHETAPTAHRLATAAAPGENFTLSYAPSGAHTATVTIAGPFAADTSYEVRFHTIPINPAKPYFDRGAALKTTTTFMRFSSSATNYDGSGALLDGREHAGFGGFTITNLVQGGAAEKMPADARFIITGTYTLPNGALTSDYPNWQAPGTVRADKTGGTFTMTVEKDSSASPEYSTRPGEPVLFPLGTVIYFKQQQPQDTAEYAWSAPVFRMHDDTITGIVLNEDKTHIEVVNHVQLKQRANLLYTIPIIGGFVGPLVAAILGLLPGTSALAGSSSSSLDPASSQLFGDETITTEEDGLVLGRPNPGAESTLTRTPEAAPVSPIHVSEMLEASGASWVVLALATLIIIVAVVVLVTSVNRNQR